MNFLFNKLLQTLAFCLVTSISCFGQEVITKSIEIDDLIREYSIYIPADYDPNNSHPLLLNLHGFGDSGLIQLEYGDFRPLADQHNFLILLPTGTNYIYGNNYWNAGYSAAQLSEGPDDVKFIETIIDLVVEEYTIDQNRIYGTGFSQGGYMTYFLSCVFDRFAAIAVVGSAMSNHHFLICPEYTDLPILSFHGTNDRDVFIAAAESTLEYLTIANRCNPIPEIIELEDIDTTDNSTVEKWTYDCADESPLIHYRILKGLHSWPGTYSEASASNDQVNYDIDASQIIWDFFNKDFVSSSSIIDKVDQDFSIAYPNPAIGKIYIETNQTDFSIQLFNGLGKEVLSKSIAGNNKAEIYVDSFPEGIYYIRVSTSKQYQLHKVTIV